MKNLTQCNTMWVKTTCCFCLCLLLIIRKYVYNFLLVQTYTSTQASTYRRLQPSLVLQLLLEGSYNPLTLVLADIFTSMQVVTYRRLRPSLFLQGPCFINFQTRSINDIIIVIQSSNTSASTNHFLNQPQPNRSITLTTHQTDHSEYINQNPKLCNSKQKQLKYTL